MKQIFFKNVNKNWHGFTLIELMVTLAVLAVVVSMAAPSFNRMIVNSRSSSLSSELTAAINFTRSEAVKRVRRVSICPSSDGESCLTSDDWAKGWLVFVDKAASDSATPVVDFALKYWNRIDQATIISLKKSASSASVEYLRFNSKGMLARTDPADTGRTFDMYISGCKGDARRTISIGLAGAINARKTSCP